MYYYPLLSLHATILVVGYSGLALSVSEGTVSREGIPALTLGAVRPAVNMPQATSLPYRDVASGDSLQ